MIELRPPVLQLRLVSRAPQARVDRSPVTLFQSVWIGSVLHMAIAAVLGILGILLLKLSTPFVVWLLVMYWITLIGLCVAFVKTLRSPRHMTLT